MKKEKYRVNHTIDLAQARELMFDWLEKKKNSQHTNLHMLANIYLKRVKRLNLPPTLMPFDDPQESNNYQNNLDLAVSELSVVFMKYFETLSLVDIQQIENGQLSKLLSQIINKQINKLKDKNRQKKYNPFKFTYKEARKYFSDASDIFTKEIGKKVGILYSFKEDSPIIQNQSLFAEELVAYETWVNPKQYVSDDDCKPKRSKVSIDEQLFGFKGKHYRILGKKFWDEAGERFGQYYYLPVNEFITYLASFYGWLLSERIEFSDELDKTIADDREDFVEKINFYDGEDREGIWLLAQQVTEQWSEQERYIFYLTILADPRPVIADIETKFTLSAYKINKYKEKCIAQLKNFCEKSTTGQPISSWCTEDKKEFFKHVEYFCDPNKIDHIV